MSASPQETLVESSEELNTNKAAIDAKTFDGSKTNG